MSACRLCDKEIGTGRSFTYWKHRPFHRDCFQELCRLMPHWVPDDKDDG